MSTQLDSSNTSTPYPLRAIAELHEMITRVAEASLFGLDVDEQDEFTREALRAGERLSAVVAITVAEADRSGMAVLKGHGTLNAHLAHHTGGPTAAIAPIRTIGLWIDQFPLFADAWMTGDLTTAHVRELKKLDNVRTHHYLIRDQQIHISSAQALDFDDWISALAYWLLHADPDGSLTPEREASYGISTRVDANGDVNVKMKLDPLTGEAFLTVIEHEAEKMFRAEKEAGHDHGVMTDRKRKVLALMRVLKRGFARKNGRFPAPLINIVMSQNVAEDLLARLFGEPNIDFDPHNLPVDWGDIDKRCETIRGTPLDPRRTLPALLIGRLRRQVLNAAGRTLDLGTEVRLFPEYMKTALLVEARGRCETAGCDVPFMWLEADHVQPHAKLGPTAMVNGRIRCRGDNGRKGCGTETD